jgi:hypothetical protein
MIQQLFQNVHHSHHYRWNLLQDKSGQVHKENVYDIQVQAATQRKAAAEERRMKDDATKKATLAWKNELQKP